jgi:hypothetical protein
MSGKPDLKITQTDEPAGRWCSSGHFPPETFVLDGNTISMRFFLIDGNGVSGTFCESCLELANKLAQKKKAGK